MPSTNTPKQKQSAPTAVICPPPRRAYKTDGTSRMSELPFVYRPKRGYKSASNWHVTPTDDYGLACEMGREYAGHYIQFIKDNPELVGMSVLGTIASSIDFSDTSATKGYWVGFFSHIERLIYAQAKRTDVFADVDHVNAIYAEIAASRALEAQERGAA